MNTIHHPSCPARQADCLEPANCPDEATGMPCNTCWAATTASCLCGPEAQAEDQLILQTRTPDEAVLDVFTHVAQAMTDFTSNAHARRTPKGLLSCILLDNELLGDQDVRGSLGVKA